MSVCVLKHKFPVRIHPRSTENHYHISRIKASVFSTVHRPAVSEWFERNYQIGNITWGWGVGGVRVGVEAGDLFFLRE